MADRKYYSIGQVSKIANLSTKALRYYDKIGLILPDVVKDNGYRFYSKKTLLTVPIIKYYKQMGFKLEEMRDFVEGSTYSQLEQVFRVKIDELKELEREIFIKYTSVSDWYDLIMEARSVIDNCVGEVSVKFMSSQEFSFMEQDFDYNYMNSIVNIDFTKFIEDHESEVTGPVMMKFTSHREKVQGDTKRAKIVQKTITSIGKENTLILPGRMVICCYHLGSHETLGESYEKIYRFVKKRGYELGEESIERYVTDYWTSRNPEQFVTEIIIDIKDRG